MQNINIPFNKPITQFFNSEIIENMAKFCGDGPYTAKCSKFIEDTFQVKKCLMTTSCTHALEMASILIDIRPGDEVIMPSFTFVSTANAFVLRGAKIVFVDIRPDTMNIDEKLIEAAITPKTRAIVPVHYAGIACEMDTILDIARKYNLYVIEDAAQGVMSTYKGRALGSIGHLGTFSFHETKNYHSGEGGALLINSNEFIERAEIIREKGTNRSRFFRGQVDKYTWIDVGSSYLPSELNMAYLWGQFEHVEEINNDRLKTWNLYYEGFSFLAEKGLIERPTIPKGLEHNAHMFYIKLKDLESRTKLIEKLKEKQIQTAFHYVPLHSSPAGQKFGIFHGKDHFTTKESERLLRLPMWCGISEREARLIITYTSELLEH
jgi:dTDP-4-amino-4,6-dideoxygalactose transaminase